MRELFGAPVEALAVVLGLLVVVVLAVVLALALRRRVLLKVGVRNLNRRRSRTAIIVGGLMLGTMTIGAALGFGDIMAHTVRTAVITSLGQTDEIVSAQTVDAPDIDTLGQGSTVRFLSAREATAVVEAARQVSLVDGVAPGISETIAVQDLTSRQTEPQVTLFATDPAAMDGFGEITREDGGGSVGLGELGPAETFLDGEAATELDAEAGDRLALFAGGRRTELVVREIVSYDGTGSHEGALLMPLDSAQRVLGIGDRVQHVLVSNDGGEVDGAELTDEVTRALAPVTVGRDLQVEPVKQDGLERADREGATYLSLFSTFGTFTISAGILLIFLVFVMLAAERRGEMGTARAIGTQRRHLVQVFLFEGAAYDLLAAAVGAVLGLATAVGMVGLIAEALSGTGIVTIRYRITWTSFVVAFSLGTLLTLAVVVLAAWRVSRLNIVAAVRGLPQPPRRRRRRHHWLLVALCLLGGSLLVAQSYSVNDATPLLVGGSLLLLALLPGIRALGGSDRAAYTIAGSAIVVWNLLPFDVYQALNPDLAMGFSIYVLVGLLLVAGLSFVVVYNLHVVLGSLMWVFGRSRRAAPVLRTAIADPVRNRFRTGVTVGLFTLVVFTMVSGASISASFLNALDDEETFGGGFDLTAQTSPMSPIRDMDEALTTVPDLDRSAITSYAAQSYLPVEARQVGETDTASYLVRGLDEEFLGTTTYGFAARAAGYDSDEEVWDALAAQHGLAVVDAYSVPRRANFGSTVVSDFRLSGMAMEDQGFTPVEVDVSDPQSGRTIQLTVIGVLADSVPFAMLGISTSQATLAPVGASAVPSVWYFRTAPGVDPVEAADAIEAAFLGNGMQAVAQSEALHDSVSTSLTFQYLVLGFLGLGLVIGVAALGVISARSVVERRQQIGVLRALGFQARMVQTGFLVESLFVTLIGIVNGTVLGLIVANSVIQDTAEQPGWDRLGLAPPWVALAIILGVVTLSSLAATWLPSIRASRTYPAEALRYQ